MSIAAFEPFVVLFALLALGALVARLRVIDEQGVSQISSLVVNVTLPAAIFLAVAAEMSAEQLRLTPLVLTLGVGLGVITYLLGRLAGRLLHLPGPRQSVYAFAAGCTNTGFLGIPLVAAVLGPAALVTAVLYDFTTTINIFTFGVAGFEPDGRRPNLTRLIRNLLNPMFLALVFGVLWGPLLGWGLPDLLARLLSLTGDATTPLAMLALGHMLYSALGHTRLPAREIGVLGSIRLIVSPLLMLGAVWALPLNAETKAVCVLQAGMPAAMLTAILAQQYGADHRFGVTAAVGTTLLSLLTLPLLALGVIRMFG